MGHWKIEIRGIGPKKNIDRELDNDADRLALEFVSKLQQSGQNVYSAYFEYDAPHTYLREDMLTILKEQDNLKKRLFPADTCALDCKCAKCENEQLRTQNRELREVIEESKRDIERLKSGNGDAVDQLFDKYISRLNKALAATEVKP